jgi:uroporphyrinogen decarboxylase
VTARKRIQRVLRGERPDRAPISFWRHHPRHELTAQSLVEITVSFQRRYGWDFVKINPRAEYHAEAWGNRYALYLDDHRRPELLQCRVQSPTDFESLEVLDPTDGVLGEHLSAVARIRQELGPDVPVVMTVFTPLSIAAELAGYRKGSPGVVCEGGESLHRGLEAVTRTFEAFVAEVIRRGADGIFLATTRLGTRLHVSEEQFREFSVPYDLRVLRAASGGWFHILHVCGSRCLVPVTQDYPVAAYSWDMADPTNPGPQLVTQQWGRVAIGGIDQTKADSLGALEQLKAQLRAVWQDTGGLRMILGAGCVLPTTSPPELLDALREEAYRLNGH